MTYPVDDLGNPRVDFVWGNMAMQPDQDRPNSGPDNLIDGNIAENRGWDASEIYPSGTLDTSIIQSLSVGDQSEGNTNDWRNVNTRQVAVSNIHSVITTGYSNYPAYIPNYAGDGDAGLERVVPDLSKVARADMNDVLSALNLGFVQDDVFAGATLANDGKFKAQSPAKNTIANDGSNVTVSFYEAPTVPNVVDFDSVSAAADALGLAGLVLGTVTTSTVGATSGNDNWVKSQSIAPGTKVAAGTAVNLVEYDYVVASTTGPIAGFNRVSAGTSFALNGNQSVMYVAGRTVKPTVGDTISVTGSDDASHNVSWTVAEVENNDSYNTGGTAVKVTLVTGSITSDTATGGTWTKI